MAQLIRKGDVLLVDLSDRALHDGRIFAIRYAHELRLRRIFRRYDGWLILRTPWMAVRVMVYTGLLYQDLIKSGAVVPGQHLPPVFPLVLYNGTGRWTAARDIAELIAPLPGALARYRPQQRYHLIDEGRIGKETLEQATSVAAELVRLETLAGEGPAALRPILRRLSARLQGPRYASLRRALTVWFARAARVGLVPTPKPT